MIFKRQPRPLPPLVERLKAKGILNEAAAESVRLRLEERPDLPQLEAVRPFLSREELLAARVEEFDGRFPAFDLESNGKDLDPKCVDMLKLEHMRRHRCVVRAQNGESIDLIMVDPMDDFTMHFVEEFTGYRVERRMVALPEDLDGFVAAVAERSRKPTVLQVEKPPEKTTKSEAQAKRLAYAMEGVTLMREDDVDAFRGVGPILDCMIRQALLREASDIHLEPHRHGFRVRFRIDGILLDDPEVERLLDGTPRDRGTLNTMVNIIKNRSGESGKDMRIDEREKAQDGRIYLPQADIDLRVSILPTLHGESVVIRIHYREIGEFSLDQLGFEADVFRKFRAIVEAPYGMVLVSGPTGSGKTTTLYASMNLINNPNKKTLTIEDPIEYSMDGAVQSQTNPYKKFSFAEALRSFLRHDPDIIMVGEIRDHDTAVMAVEAALTGHMVLSSIHANDAASTVVRLKEMGVDPRLVTATCRGTLAQRLVRKVCDGCKRRHIYSTRFYGMLDTYAIPHDPRKLVRGTGCEQCNGTGYRGRIGIFELLIPTFEIKEMILRGCSSDEVTEVARSQGMRTLLEDALYKVARGLTTEEEVWRVTLTDGGGIE